MMPNVIYATHDHKYGTWQESRRDPKQIEVVEYRRAATTKTEPPRR